MIEDQDSNSITWIETLEITSNEILDVLKKLLHQGNVRKLILKRDNGDVLIDIPLTAGLMLGLATVIISRHLATLGLLAGVVSRIKIEVERVDNEL